MVHKKITKLVGQNRKAALIVAIVNIPLSISLAIASGGTPIQGLLTAVRAGLIASIFASSRHNIFGPAGALSGILLSTALLIGPAYLPLIAITSGLILLLIYSLKIVKYVTLIPAAGLQGFLFAVGITILVSQLAGGFGIDLSAFETSSKIYTNFRHIITSLGHLDITSTIVFIGGLIMLFTCKKFLPKIPGAIILTIIGIAIGYASIQGHFPAIKLLKDNFPNISFSLFARTPLEHYKALFQNPHHIGIILKTSVIIAIITVLETIISGKIGEKTTKQKFNKQKEILGNALANIGSGLFGGLPSTAVLVRTSLNIKNGATHKVSAGMAAILTALISLFLFDDIFVYIPVPIISAILVFIAISIMDFKTLKLFYKRKKISFRIIIVTIIVSIAEDTMIGLAVGTSIALLVFLKRVTDGSIKAIIFRNGNFHKKLDLQDYIHEQSPHDQVIIKFSGQINYLNTESYEKQLLQLESQNIILSFGQVTDIDIDGLECLDEILEHRQEQNKNIQFSGTYGDIKKMFEKSQTAKTFLNKNSTLSTSQLLERH